MQDLTPPALVAFGLSVVDGDPHDIGRTGLVYLGAFFVLPRLAVTIAGWLFPQPQSSRPK